MSDEQRGRGCGEVAGLFLVVALVVALLAVGIGYVIGELNATSQLYHQRYLEERAAIEPAVSNDPAFKSVEIHERSDGGIVLRGSVATASDKKRLLELVSRLVVEARVAQASYGVEIEHKDR
jgi:hypothetical protein